MTIAQRVRARRTRAQRVRELHRLQRQSVIAAADARISRADTEREQARPKPRRTQEPSDVLVSRGTITASQAQAGERLARDWALSMSEQRITAAYEQRTPGHDDPSVRVVDARARYEAAILSMQGEARLLVEHVFVMPRLPLSQWGEYASLHSEHRAEVARMLRAGLDALRGHYAGSHD